MSTARLESGIITAIDRAVKQNKNNPITLVARGTTIDNVIGAKKYTGRQSTTTDSYTDVIVLLKNKKDINLSLKGRDTHDSIGGSQRTIETIVPGVLPKFLKLALAKLQESGYKTGDQIPSVYGQVSKQVKEKLIVGTNAVGGPIDYIYVGSDIKSKYNPTTNKLNIEGGLVTPKYYSEVYPLYLQTLPRFDDQRFDTEMIQGGVPKIYGDSASKGGSGCKISFSTTLPEGALTVKAS